MDTFVIAGQSNASGRGDTNQPYSGTGVSRMFGNDYVLKDISDPVDILTNQVDAVSNDTEAAGSVWPLVASGVVADTGKPVLLVPCAKGGTSITQWLPGADHQDRTTLYGSMIFRALQAANYGVLRMVLWWQGESDAISGMSTATYQGHLQTISDAVFADLGIPLVPAKLQTSAAEAGYTNANRDKINAAIGNLWGTGHVVAGPDLSVLTTDDAFHIKTNTNLEDASDLWITSIVNIL